MKKLIIIAIAFVSLQAIAQDRQKGSREVRKERIQDLTPEELAQLKTKKMTLHLDLDERQQNKIYDLVLEQVKVRKAKLESRKGEDKKELTKEERLELANEKLDAQIAFKKQMKSVLSDEQYEKFEKSFSRTNKRKMKSSRKKQKH
ncbi:hypothetical protein [Winogradskyella sp. 3972H.M.0a.05]|uniref:hypothetical protein n=1 Tax=Winogradskyella sp. 3972H.M.0a.05 TaxID=2950277 RepID=UPI0033967FBF